MICVTISSSRPFATVFGPVLPELDAFHWLLNFQSGPFHIADRPDFHTLEKLTESLWVDVPLLGNGSASLWRPGTVSRLAHLLVHDEQQYHFALSPDREHAIAACRALANFSPENSIAALEEHTHFLAYYACDFWEVFAPDADLGAKL